MPLLMQSSFALLSVCAYGPNKTGSASSALRASPDNGRDAIYWRHATRLRSAKYERSVSFCSSSSGNPSNNAFVYAAVPMSMRIVSTPTAFKISAAMTMTSPSHSGLESPRISMPPCRKSLPYVLRPKYSRNTVLT